MKLLRTTLLAMTVGLLATACVLAARPGSVPVAPETMPQVKDLDALIPAAGGDDPQARGNAQKAIEVMAMNAARPGAEAERAAVAKALAAKLGPATPQLARVWLLRQLQLMGRAEVVPAIAALLDDKDALVRESARRALQYIPAEEAAAALRGALDRAAAPEWRVAVINALGGRKDATSVPAIAKLAADKDESVAAAAAAALGRIGGPEAAQALRAARAAAPAKLKPAVTDAYLLCADQLLAAGKKPEAEAIYKEVYTPSEPKPTRLAALRGLVLTAGEGAIALIADGLASPDPQTQGISMSLAQEVPGPAATKALADLAPKLAPPMQASLIGLLGRRGDAVAKPAVLAAAKSADDSIRIAALGALGTLGDASDVMFLAKTAAGAPGPESDAARASLAALRGADINKAALNAMATPDAKVRAELLRALAARRAAEAVPVIVKSLGDADAAVRIEGAKSLETLGDEKAVPPLIAYLAKAQTDEENQAAEKALLAACGRAANKDACLQPVMAALPQSKMPAHGSLLRALGRLGGDKALAAARTAAADADPKVKEAAVRALADWPDSAAGPDLLAIAKSDTKGTLPVLGLRGYIRLAGLPEQAPAQKMQMCREALAVAKRPEEKRAVLAVLGEVNTAESLKMISPMLDDGTVKEEAAQAATKVAKALGNNLPPETKEMMEKVITFTKNKNAQKDANEVLKKVKPPKK